MSSRQLVIESLTILLFDVPFTTKQIEKTIYFPSIIERPKIGKNYNIYVKKINPEIITSPFSYKYCIYGLICFSIILGMLTLV